MSFTTRLKEIPVVRWAWDKSPAFIRNWVGSKAPDLSVDDRPPAFRIAGQKKVRLRPGGSEDLTPFLHALEQARLILHISEGYHSIHHMDLWQPYCQAADPSLLIVLRSRPLFDRVVAERPDLTIVYVRNARQSEWLVSRMPNTKAVLYDANTGNIIHFIRFPHLRHIFLGHGDSEKLASCGKHFRSHDEIWTAGQAHIDRFANSGIDFSSLRFRIIGRPQVRSLVESNKKQTHFIYLPTWEGYHQEQDYSSILKISDILNEISYRVGKHGFVKLHPSTGKRDKKLLAIEKNMRGDSTESPPISGSAPDIGITAVDRSYPAINLMANASFLISDISSVLSDFLVTGQPIFLYIPFEKQIKTSKSSVSFKSYCYIFSNPQELLTLVDEVIIQGDDSLHESRLAARNYFVNIDATRNQALENELSKLIDGTSNPADAIRLIT